MRRPAQAVLLALLAVAMPGCSTVPTSGEAVVVGKAPAAVANDDDPGAPQGIRRAGTRRAPDADPVDVVTGFLNAEADISAEGTEIAHDYLTAPSIWDANGGAALVYTTKQIESMPDDDPAVERVKVTYTQLARISASTDANGTPRLTDGEYRPAVGRAMQEFTLAKGDDGWRISELPRGRRISVNDLQQVYQRVVPYYYSNSNYDTLVPDPTYLLGRTKLIERVVQRLIDGPSPVLADFLPRSVFPAGTQLLLAPEPVDGVAEVTFSRHLEEGPRADRKKIVAQLVWTLTAMDSRIVAVRVKVADKLFDFDDEEAEEDEQRQTAWTAYDPDTAYASRTSYFNLEGSLGRYRPSSAVRGGRLLGDGTAASVPAVDHTDTSVAVAAQVGDLLELRLGPVASGPLVPQQVKSERLTNPSWGTAADGVWVVAQQGLQPPQLLRVAGDASTVGVAAPELNERVHAFEVSPDGLRVAIIIERNGNRSLEVGYIERDAVGNANRVGGFRPVVDAADTAADAVVWLDSGKLGFIGRRGEESPQVSTVLVDGTDLQISRGSREIIETNGLPSVPPAPPLPQAQLVPLAVRHEGKASRGGNTSTSDAIMLVIDATKLYVNRGNGWVLLPQKTRNQ